MQTLYINKRMGEWFKVTVELGSNNPAYCAEGIGLAPTLQPISLPANLPFEYFSSSPRTSLSSASR